VPPAEAYFDEWAAASNRARSALLCELDVAYGGGERERLDLFPANATNAPCFVWIHGGYWRRLDKSYSSFLAGPLVAAGCAVALLNYPLVATATLDEIVAAVRRAFAWIAHNAPRLGADPHRIVVGGHSAGGHLAGMLAATNWRAYSLPADAVKGVFAVSGLFDLEPVRLSHVNEWLKIDREAAHRNSPLLHVPERSIPLVAAVGADESLEFKKQSRDYVETWAALGYPARHLEPAGCNHFSVVSELARRDSETAKTLVELLDC
jgi:arylformamidase